MLLIISKWKCLDRFDIEISNFSSYLWSLPAYLQVNGASGSSNIRPPMMFVYRVLFVDVHLEEFVMLVAFVVLISKGKQRLADIILLHW